MPYADLTAIYLIGPLSGFYPYGSTKGPYLNSPRVFYVFSLCAELETMYNAKDV
jgi:hypothetical protein